MRVTVTRYRAEDHMPYQVSIEYGPENARSGKYDSGFHAYLVERCQADDWAGNTNFGGVVKYGKRLDWWSNGFHTLERFDNEQLAQEAFDVWAVDFYAEVNSEYES